MDTINEEDSKCLADIMKRDPLAEISEQEKDMLWKLRKHCLSMPNILPRLLDAVNWGSRDHITQVYLLLKEWPPVSSSFQFVQIKNFTKKSVKWEIRLSQKFEFLI